LQLIAGQLLVLLLAAPAHAEATSNAANSSAVGTPWIAHGDVIEGIIGLRRYAKFRTCQGPQVETGPAIASGTPADTRPNDGQDKLRYARDRLSAYRGRVEGAWRRSQELQAIEEKIAGGAESINARVVETTEQIHRSEAQLGLIEARLRELQ
jgi:hypothetical protein